MRRVLIFILLAACVSTAQAQNLGPFRQFLAIEPYYTRFELDAGPGAARMERDGYGGRLWINLAPFTGEHWILPSTGGIALFASYVPEKNGQSKLWHYGAQHDVFFGNRPVGGWLDPFISIGVGALRASSAGRSNTDVTALAGGGLRIPIPNRLQLRGDVRDAILFNQRSGTTSSKRTTHNLEIQAALGITF